MPVSSRLKALVPLVASAFVTGMLLACGAQKPRAAQVLEVTAESDSPPPKPTLEISTPWTLSSQLNSRVPATEDELDDLEAKSPFVAATRGRVIWMDLRDPPTRALLGSVSGPLSVTIDRPDPELLKTVEEIAARYPVEVTVELAWAEALDPPPDISGLERLKHVEGLSIRLSMGTAKLPDFRRLPRLKRLDVFGPAVGQNLSQQLPTSLEILEAVVDLPEECIEDLAQLPQLRRLWLPLTPVRLHGLHQATSLEELHVSVPLRVPDVVELRGLPKLRTLVLRTDLAPAAFTELGELTSLRKLAFLLPELEFDSVEPLDRLTQLEALEVDTPSREETLMAITQLHGLRSLDLYHAKLTRTTLEGLAALPLEELNLMGSEFDPADASVFSRFTQLRRLVIADTPADTRVLDALSKLPNLRYLSAARLPLDDSAVRSLLALKHLRTLDISGTKISPTELPRLVQLSELRTLWFDGAPSSDIIAQLVATPHLLFFSQGPAKLNCVGSDWPEACPH
ncbi:MAG: hypothetical protein R3B07_06985 [Polyangiaceae bacterium]